MAIILAGGGASLGANSFSGTQTVGAITGSLGNIQILQSDTFPSVLFRAGTTVLSQIVQTAAGSNLFWDIPNLNLIVRDTLGGGGSVMTLTASTKAMQVGGNIVSIAGAIQYLGAAAGTDTITVSPTPAIGSYTTGAFFIVKALNANATTTPTLNINSMGAKTIVKRTSTALAANDILASMFCFFIYDGTNMVLLNPVVN